MVDGPPSTDAKSGELSTRMGRAAAAVWPLLDEPTLAKNDAGLAALEPIERVLAMLLLGPTAVYGVEATREHAVGRMQALAAGARLMADALERDGQRDVTALDRLWQDLERSSGDRRWLSAATLAVTAVLPLGLDQTDALIKLGDLEIVSLVAFAIGRAAHAGDPAARVLLRDALATPLSDVMQRPLVETALVLGLGDGLAREGLERLTRSTERAILDAPLWGNALRTAIVGLTSLDFDDPSLRPAIAVALVSCEDRQAVSDFLGRLPRALAAETIDRAAADLETWPAPVRAALLAEWPVAHIATFLEHLPYERAPAAILTVLERVHQHPAAPIPPELLAELGRAWSDHPDAAVRRALVSASALFGTRPHVHEDADASAEVVTLPASALARDDIDRLRVALWSGDSDRIVELATHVPLDRRGPAREALLGALEVPHAALRRAIVEAIGRIGSHADGPRLLEAARRYRALEGTVAAALRELNARALAEKLAEIYRRRLKWADDDAVDDYCAIAGPEQIMHLLGALDTRYYPSARAGAARAIARRKAHEVVFVLRNAGLTDNQEPSRLAALGALHDLTGTSPSADELAGHALLFRPSDELPEAIERAREAGASVLQGIRRTLARGSWKRRRAVCDVLATMTVAPEEATAVLVDVLSDPDEDVRLAALEALVQRGWTSTTPREKTLAALAGRRTKDLLKAPDDLDLETLVAALRLGGHVFRTEVLEVLDRVPGFELTDPETAALVAAARLDFERTRALPLGLEAMLRAVDNTWQSNPHRARFVRGLIAVDPDDVARELEGTTWGWRAREAACQALGLAALAGRAMSDVVIQALQRQITEEDDDVRKAAFQALAWIGSEAAAEAVASGFQSPFQEDRDVVAQALAAFGAAALPVLDRLTRESWWEDRQGAGLTLANWRTNARIAADRLIGLAVDPEYRVSQGARDGLGKHGLIPRGAAIVDALDRAQTLTLEGLEPWLLLQLQHASPETAARLDTLVEETPPDLLPQRIGLIALFRAEHLALWLEDAAHGRTTRHIGVRLAAADALRALTRRACPVCRGERSVRCPSCNGAGDAPCPTCAGRGVVMVPCPDPECTAKLAMRPIGSKRCMTCRGRGEVPEPCVCQKGAMPTRIGGDGEAPVIPIGGRGRVACEMCAGAGRLACQACDGSGEARRNDRLPPT